MLMKMRVPGTDAILVEYRPMFGPFAGLRCWKICDLDGVPHAIADTQIGAWSLVHGAEIMQALAENDEPKAAEAINKAKDFLARIP